METSASFPGAEPVVGASLTDAVASETKTITANKEARRVVVQVPNLKEGRDPESGLPKPYSSASPKHVQPPGAAFVARRLIKIVGVVLSRRFSCLPLMRWPSTFIDNVDSKATVMTALFLAGLVIVVVEDHVNVNKAAIMLMVSAAMWTFLAVGYRGEAEHDELEKQLNKGLHDVGSIILFLLPAMGVVESIDHFNGFEVVTTYIKRVTGQRKGLLMPILCFLSFFLSDHRQPNCNDRCSEDLAAPRWSRSPLAPQHWWPRCHCCECWWRVEPSRRRHHHDVVVATQDLREANDMLAFRTFLHSGSYAHDRLVVASEPRGSSGIPGARGAAPSPRDQVYGE